MMSLLRDLMLRVQIELGKWREEGVGMLTLAFSSGGCRGENPLKCIEVYLTASNAAGCRLVSHLVSLFFPTSFARISAVPKTPRSNR